MSCNSISNKTNLTVEPLVNILVAGLKKSEVLQGAKTALHLTAAACSIHSIPFLDPRLSRVKMKLYSAETDFRANLFTCSMKNANLRLQMDPFSVQYSAIPEKNSLQISGARWSGSLLLEISQLGKARKSF